MKSIFIIVLIGMMVTLTGCDQGTSGGPGSTSPPSKNPVMGQADDTFSLAAPSVTLNQGETRAISTGIKRGTNFNGDVSLEIADLPMGVNISPSSPVIKQEDMEAMMTLQVADDAALGDFTIEITGRPTEGANAVSEMKITITPHTPTAEETAAVAKVKWDEYTADMQKRLDESDAKLAEMRERAIKAEGQVKVDLEAKLATAQARHDAAAAKLEEIKAATAERWEKVKEGVGNAFDDLKTIFE